MAPPTKIELYAQVEAASEAERAAQVSQGTPTKPSGPTLPPHRLQHLGILASWYEHVPTRLRRLLLANQLSFETAPLETACRAFSKAALALYQDRSTVSRETHRAAQDALWTVANRIQDALEERHARGLSDPFGGPVGALLKLDNLLSRYDGFFSSSVVPT